MNGFQKEFASLADPEYRLFSIKLIPNLSPDRILGVRMPDLRAFANKWKNTKEARDFLRDLPHATCDENTLHAVFLNHLRDPREIFPLLDEFLPFVDNWATCDCLAPAALKKDLPAAKDYALRCMDSDKTYTVRFGIGLAMRHFLDQAFDPDLPERIAAIRSDEYYINMMIAWYFATCLAKQRSAALPYFTEERLAPEVRRKAIQKALESFRILPEDKEMLKAIRATLPR